jgi:hypothetical protein
VSEARTSIGSYLGFYDALRAAKLGQRKRVAHMPTAGAEDTEGGMIRFEKTLSLSDRGFK